MTSTPTETNPMQAIAKTIPTAVLQEPSWQTVRDGLQQVKAAGQTYLVGQVWLGWQLACLKEIHQELGGGRGGDRKSMAHDAPLIAWGDIVFAETGLKRHTADRLIQLFDAVKAKLKRVKGPIVTKSYMLSFERENPLAIAPEDAGELRDIIASLCEGESQASMLYELKVITAPKCTLGGDTSEHRKDKPQITTAQLAFNFFAPVADSVHKLCLMPNLSAYLCALEIDDDEEGTLTLTSIERQFQALLDDIKAAKKAKLQSLRSAAPRM